MIGKAVNGVKWTQNRTRQKPAAVVSCHSRVEQNIQASAPASLGSTDRLETWRGFLLSWGLVYDRILVGSSPQGSFAILKLNWEGFNGFKGFCSQCDGIR